MSNRDAILSALRKSTVATAEELTETTGWPGRKVRDTLSDLKKIGAITSGRDDVTGRPAYRLADPKTAKSAAGKAPATTEKSSAVAEKSSVTEAVKPVIKKSLMTEAVKPVVKDCLMAETPKPVVLESRTTESTMKSVTTQAGSGDITPAAADDSTSQVSVLPGQAAAVIEPPPPDDSPAAVRSVDKRNLVNQQIIDFCEWMGEMVGGGVMPINLQECKGLIAALGAVGIDLLCKLTAQDAAIKVLNGGVSTRTAKNHALKVLGEVMPGFCSNYAARTKGPFVVRIPGKPPVFTGKYANAKAVAMSAARQKLGGEVFALIPIGKAVRGAEWKERS